MSLIPKQLPYVFEVFSRMSGKIFPKRKLILAICLSFFALFNFYFTGISSARFQDSTFRGNKISLKLENATIIYALDTLAVDKDVFIGFEVSPNETFDPKINLNIHDVSVEEALNYIFSQEKKYKWEKINHMYFVFPAIERSEFLKEFLDTKLTEFNISEKTIFGFKEELFLQKEVANLMSKYEISIDSFSDSIDSSTVNSPLFNIQVNNLKILQILNLTLGSDKRKIWVISVVGKNKKRLCLAL
jgi:hypothetical protein